ncbi:MAG: type II toxin-antitoxin system PemK/MazF family toxin [Candidatus Acidiferrales bacterium]
MKRGEIYRNWERLPERGYKAGFYVVVSRDFVVGNDELVTVVCAPIYSVRLGIRSEVPVGPEDGLPADSAIRCDFLTSVLKKKLTGFVGTLSAAKLEQLKPAIRYALSVD